MEIEIEGPHWVLEEFRLYLHDQLARNGFVQGPKIDRVETGLMIEYLKGDVIFSLEITSELEAKNSKMHLESSREIPEFADIWDQALIQYGIQNDQRLVAFARDKQKVKKGLGRS